MIKEFDLIIIGGGAGGFAAAIKAEELGAKTLLINSDLPWGGTCVNVGCVPSKALLWAAEIMHLAKNHHIPGIEFELKKFDFQKVISDELSLVEKLRKEKYEKVLEGLKNVEAIEGKASFVSREEVEVRGKRLKAKKFVVATGSSANVPPIEGIQEVGFITHIEALRLSRQPNELIIIGGGPVGLEFGQMFARFGTKVTLLEFGPTILPYVEKPLRERLVEVLEKEGITIVVNAKTKRAFKDGNKKVVVAEIEGQEKVFEGDEILLAAGKTANTKNMGLELAGVEVNERGAIKVNSYLQTSNPNVFAVGDVIEAPLRLETTAGKEGTVAAENALEGKNLALDYNTVPFTIFTDPQVAGVGITETRQMKEEGRCNCRTIPFEFVPKALIMKRTEGLIHLALDIRSPKIVGMQILAPNAGEIISLGAMIVKNKNTIDDVINSLPVFPTLSEAIKTAALSFKRDVSKLSCCI